MLSQHTSRNSRNDLKTTLLTGLAALAIFAGMTCPALPGRHSAALAIPAAQHDGIAGHAGYRGMTQNLARPSRIFIALR